MISKIIYERIKASLVLHEGWKNRPYVDSVGKISIGCGYNLTDRGLDDAWINNQLSEDISYFYNQLCSFAWYHTLNPDRQIILIDMAFMGWKRFLSFGKMLQALEEGNYGVAADEMLHSKWAEEVKGRALALAEGMRSGVYNIGALS